VAGLGFKDFTVGEVLTSANVDGYLMQQTVMRFADAGARGSALGTAPGTAVALAEGMVSYLDDTNAVEVFTGTVWRGIGGFNASTTITATDASWPVPSLADPVVRVTVVGGGGGAEPDSVTVSSGSSSSFACSAGTATAAGGARALGAAGSSSSAGTDAGQFVRANNGGVPGVRYVGAGDFRSSAAGQGGVVTVAYLDLTGVSTANVTVGAGDTVGADSWDADGGDGVVIVEYRAA